MLSTKAALIIARGRSRGAGGPIGWQSTGEREAPVSAAARNPVYVGSLVDGEFSFELRSSGSVGVDVGGVSWCGWFRLFKMVRIGWFCF